MLYGFCAVASHNRHCHQLPSASAAAAATTTALSVPSPRGAAAARQAQRCSDDSGGRRAYKGNIKRENRNLPGELSEAGLIVALSTLFGWGAYMSQKPNRTTATEMSTAAAISATCREVVGLAKLKIDRGCSYNIAVNRAGRLACAGCGRVCRMSVVGTGDRAMRKSTRPAQHGTKRGREKLTDMPYLRGMQNAPRTGGLEKGAREEKIKNLAQMVVHYLQKSTWRRTARSRRMTATVGAVQETS